MYSDFIPVNEPLLDGNERAYLNECVSSGWISSEGPFVQRLETGMAHYVGRKHGIAVSSGSTALDLAVEALGLQAGDEVIIPTFTIISCAAPLVRRGIIPICVDCDPHTYTMETHDLDSFITPRTKAIMAVHIYGMPVNMDKIAKMAERHNLRVIEDAAQAHGLSYKSQPCGSFGDISIFSFYPNKHVTTGEGGMVLVDNPELAERCRSLRNLCFGEKQRFVHHELGFNYRMSNVQAALGVAQLERLDQFIARKHEIGAYYSWNLAKHEEHIQLPIAHTEYAKNGYWVFPIVLKDALGVNASQFMKRLKEKGIGSRPFFFPMHQQPVFVSAGMFKDVSLPHAEHIAERGLYIPSGLALTIEQQESVVRALEETIAELF